MLITWDTNTLWIFTERKKLKIFQGTLNFIFLAKDSVNERNPQKILKNVCIQSSPLNIAGDILQWKANKTLNANHWPEKKLFSCELEKLIEFLSRFDNRIMNGERELFVWIILEQFVYFFSLYADSRTKTRLLSQWFAGLAWSYPEFHQNTFTNGRECSSVLWISNFDARRLAVSSLWI